jgi:hypothetical protein
VADPQNPVQLTYMKRGGKALPGVDMAAHAATVGLENGGRDTPPEAHR